MTSRKDKENIINYCDGVFDLYPKYSKYLTLNNYIATYILDIYYSIFKNSESEYTCYFDDVTSYELSYEILSSLSDDLALKFKNYIDSNIIEYNDDYKTGTYLEDGNIKCRINHTHKIIDSITMIHEFFHSLHLEKYGEISYEDYYFYCEILGLVGDFYSIFYIINSKNELHDDIISYLNEYIKKLAAISDESLSFGTLLEVYKEKHSISSFSIKKYVKEHNLSKKYTHLLELYKNTENFNYHEQARYIFSFPISLMISIDLINNPTSYYKYKEVFDLLPHISAEEALHKLGIDKYLNDEKELCNIMKVIYNNLLKISDDKVKIKEI